MNQDLHSLNLPQNALNNLNNSGYFFCNDINSIESNSNIPQAFSEALKPPETISCLQLFNEFQSSSPILTLNKNVDDALGGGIFLKQLTEVYGKPGCGKSKFCAHLCTTVQLPLWCGGLQGQVIYLSTDKDFTQTTLKVVAEKIVSNYNTIENVPEGFDKNDFSVETVLNNTFYMPISGYLELVACVRLLKYWLESYKNVKLVIIDDIESPFGDVEAEERNQILFSLLQQLATLAYNYDFAALLTNNYTTRTNAEGATLYVPSLGEIYAHRINTRIELIHRNVNTISIKLIKSANGHNFKDTFNFPL